MVKAGFFNGAGGSWWEQQFWGGGQLLGHYDGSTTYFIHRSDVGSSSPTQITTGSGSLSGDETFYPWGQQWEYDNEANSWWQFYGGISRYQADLNLYLTPHRFYSSSYGRWLTPDPSGRAAVSLTNPQSWNMYAYALNNPETLNDPSGLQPPCSGQANCESYGQNYADYQTYCATVDCGGINREFSWMLLPVVAETYSPARLFSSINWSSFFTPNKGFATSVGLFQPGGWTTTPVGTGLDLIGLYENPAALPSFWAGAPMPAPEPSAIGSGPPPPSGNNCGHILAKGALQTGLDALAIIPGEGDIAGAFYGGREAFQALQFAAGMGSTGISIAGSDTTGIGIGATAIGVGLLEKNTTLVKGAAEAIPIFGQIVGSAATPWDIGSTFQEYGECRGW